MLMQSFFAYHHLLLQAFNTRMQQPAARGGDFRHEGSGSSNVAMGRSVEERARGEEEAEEQGQRQTQAQEQAQVQEQ